MNQSIRMNKKDNVTTVIQNISLNQDVEIIDKHGCALIIMNARDHNNMGHKIALQDIPEGELVFKYGFTIGKAIVNLNKGNHVHLHNIESQKGRGDLGKTKQ